MNRLTLNNAGYPQYSDSNELEFLGFMARRLNLSLQSLLAAVEPDAPESQRLWGLSASPLMLLIYEKKSSKHEFVVPSLNPDFRTWHFWCEIQTLHLTRP